MEKLELNSSHKGNAVINSKVPIIMPILMLPIRTILFALIQTAFVYLLGFTWTESIAWWPFYAIITNVLCFFLLIVLARKEGKNYFDIIHFDKKGVKKDLKSVLWVLLTGGGIGFIGLSLVGYLIYGSFIPPDHMILPLPFWAGIVSLILFPITIALVEIPTYMGYCFTRLEQKWNSKWKAVTVSAFFLALQHFTLPIIFSDFKYMYWHFLGMIPLAFAVGIIFMKIRRLLPIMIVHLIMDTMAILEVFLLSI